MNILSTMLGGDKKVDAIVNEVVTSFNNHTEAMKEHTEALKIASEVNTKLAIAIAESGKND